MKWTVLLLSAVAAFGQVSVDQVTKAEVQQFYKDASGNLQYICASDQYRVRVTSVQRSDSSLTSIAVSTNVGTVTTASAHGLWIGARVTVSGSTTAALNGTYTVASVPSSTTYTIATSGVSDATYNNAAMVISTSQPLLTNPVWMIQVYVYDNTNFLTGAYLAKASTGGLKCSERSLY